MLCVGATRSVYLPIYAYFSNMYMFNTTWPLGLLDKKKAIQHILCVKIRIYKFFVCILLHIIGILMTQHGFLSLVSFRFLSYDTHSEPISITRSIMDLNYNQKKISRDNSWYTFAPVSLFLCNVTLYFTNKQFITHT